MKKLLKVLIIIILVIFAVPKMIETAKNFFGENEINEQLLLETDEEKIEFVINSFNKAYSDGDFNGVTDCFTPKSKNSMKAQFGLSSQILSAVFGWFTKGFLSIDEDGLGDMWTMGTSLYSMQFDIENIEITDENNAVAHGNIIQIFHKEDMSSSLPGYIKMQKEDGLWRIEDLFYTKQG